jgi:tRNA uridine 5-carboxymethylaminomethyl modification enzyme
LKESYPEEVVDHGPEINSLIELKIKYAGYERRQQEEVARFENIENRSIPSDFDYALLKGLSREAVQKLTRVRPQTVGQASRIPGVSPSDLSILLIALRSSKEFRSELKEFPEGG